MKPILQQLQLRAERALKRLLTVRCPNRYSVTRTPPQPHEVFFAHLMYVVGVAIDTSARPVCIVLRTANPMAGQRETYENVPNDRLSANKDSCDLSNILGLQLLA
jgi:hypothetical protein